MSERLNIVIDATMFDMFELCEARFNMRFNLNKVSVEKAKPLDRGTIVHVGAENYYKSLQQGMKYQDAVDAMLKAMDLSIAECDLEPDECRRIVEVMLEYADHWRVEDQNLKIKEVEQSFSYVLYEDAEVRIIMIGKIDMITDEKLSSNLPYDHKSYDREYPTKRLTNQFCNYAVATNSPFFIVNKIGFQKTLKAEQKFKRVPLSYDAAILDKWKANVTRVILYRYIPAVVDNVWPMNFTSCDKFNRLCEYFEVCDSSGREAELYKLNVNFKSAEPWDVSRNQAKDKQPTE